MTPTMHVYSATDLIHYNASSFSSAMNTVKTAKEVYHVDIRMGLYDLNLPHGHLQDAMTKFHAGHVGKF